MTGKARSDGPSLKIRVGGLIDPRTDIYVTRDCATGRLLEEELEARLLAMRSTVVIGSRQVGKSSLANYVSLRMARSGKFRTAWIDVDGLVESPEPLSTTFLNALAYELEVAPPANPASFVSALHELLGEGGLPLLIVIDEFDALLRRGIDGEDLLRALRAAQQAPRLRERFVLCVLSVRATSMLFQAEAARGLGSASELNVEPLQIGLFSFTDETRRQLQTCFTQHDRAASGNLARWVLEQSGGYPQLCMALAARLIETGTRYSGVPADMEAFFANQVRWFRDRGAADASHFLRTPAAFLRWFPAEQTLDALRRYQELLDREALMHEDPLGISPLRWDAADDALYLLSLTGLVRRDGDHARTIGGFMDRFFDRAWIQKLSEDISRGQPRRDLSRPLPRIAVLITGGTIGMVERDGQIQPPRSVHELEKEYGAITENFDVQWLTVESLDSANVGPRQWKLFANEIHQQLLGDVQGVVVAHGTDTLAYTASAVAFALGEDLSKPVVFTGSQTTVDQVHGDSRTNLLRACMVAAHPDLAEVVIVFNEQVLRGVRAVKHDDRRFDAFESFLYPPLGMVSEAVELQPEILRKSAGRPLPSVRSNFQDDILVISQHPALPPEFFRAALENERVKPRGIVIQTLGAGNIPTNEPYDLTPVILLATQRRIPVILASQYPVHPENLGRYGPSARALSAGAIPVANMTMAAIVAKLSWVLGQSSESPGREEIQSQMLYNYVGEIDDRDAAALKATSIPRGRRRSSSATTD